MNNIEIIKVTDKKNLKKFIDFPHDLYNGDPNYVPELYIQAKQILDRKKNPFFEHAIADYFIAVKNKQVVGRIAAIKDYNFIDSSKEKVGLFGFFDSINDKEVAHALFNAVMQWAKEKDLEKILGPSNLSTNNTSFLLIDGFDKPPYVMMPYNKPYYKDLIESFDFTKKVDVLAYECSKKAMEGERFIKIAKLGKLVEKRLEAKDIFIRNIDIKNFESELRLAQYVYNTAWEKNLDFVPMTDNEFKLMAKELKLIINPKLTFLAFHGNKPIGVSISIPNINEHLIKVKRGRLLPCGIFKLLNIKKVKGVRPIIQGVLENYRHLGIDACFISKLVQNGKEANVMHAELSWILENNAPVVNMFSNMQLPIYKRYRFFTKSV